MDVKRVEARRDPVRLRDRHPRRPDRHRPRCPEWAREAERLGAGEICLNSIDADGTRDGYEIRLTSLISGHLGIPVIASGGAGTPEHLYDVLTRGRADAALIASMVHYRTHTLADIKAYLSGRGVPVREHWA